MFVGTIINNFLLFAQESEFDLLVLKNKEKRRSVNDDDDEEDYLMRNKLNKKIFIIINV